MLAKRRLTKETSESDVAHGAVLLASDHMTELNPVSAKDRIAKMLPLSRMTILTRICARCSHVSKHSRVTSIVFCFFADRGVHDNYVKVHMFALVPMSPHHGVEPGGASRQRYITNTIVASRCFGRS